ncbi:MAG: hypothetical protein JWM90_256 [Thermoleophilia bacterium]|nr:hypothetical protein [Thermoleophilia bacterium]
MDPLDLNTRIGTAGWSVPPEIDPRDADARRAGGVLGGYARLFDACELNSSFYRHHRPSTWARWAEAVPDGFQFSAKLPKAISHEARLATGPSLPVLDRFLEEHAHLGDRRGPLLLQLPPSLVLDEEVADRFFHELRARWNGFVACEPRHASWFGATGTDLLARHRVARVVADPPPDPSAAEPGGWSGLVYVRLHGSPRVYYSAYGPAYIEKLSRRLRAFATDDPQRPVWCIFDNTASGAAIEDSLELRRRLRPE